MAGRAARGGRTHELIAEALSDGPKTVEEIWNYLWNRKQRKFIPSRAGISVQLRTWGIARAIGKTKDGRNVYELRVHPEVVK